MGGLFSGPSMPAPPPPPPEPPKRKDTEAKAKAADARRRAANATGRRQTILTGGSGVDTDDSLIKRTSILGGGSAA